MKNSIGWHKECLKNMIIGAGNKRSAADRAIAEAMRLEEDVAFLTRQIVRAESLKKDGFDSELFMARTHEELKTLWANRPVS